MKKVIPAVALAALLCAPSAFAAGTSADASASAGSNVNVVSNPSSSAVSNPSLVSNPNQVSTQSLVSNPNSSLVSNPSSSVTQNYQAADPGMGRPFAFPVQPYQAQLMGYFEQANRSLAAYNTLPDSELYLVLPKVLTWEQAERTSKKGDVIVAMDTQFETSYQFTTCELLRSLPMKPLLNADGTPTLGPVLDRDGKPTFDKNGKAVMAPVMVPDESKFRQVGVIYMKGKNNATSTQVDAAGRKKAMYRGADAVVLIKRVISSSVYSSGWGIGTAVSKAELSSAGQTNSFVGSGGTGYSSATAGHEYNDCFIYLAIQTKGGMHAVDTQVVQKKQAGTD